MENKYKLWVARDKNGFLFVYEDKPTRCDIRKEWLGRCEEKEVADEWDGHTDKEVLNRLYYSNKHWED